VVNLRQNLVRVRRVGGEHRFHQQFLLLDVGAQIDKL
jgi:hypothetical protein